MKKLILLLGLLGIFLSQIDAQAYSKLRNKQGIVSTTQNDTVTNTTYTNMVIDACICNDGTNEIFVDFFGTATSADIPVLAGEKFCASNIGTYSISTICSTGETSAMRIITLEEDQP